MDVTNQSHPYGISGIGGVVTARELLNSTEADVPMLWGSFLPQTALAGLAGSSDCGKSTLLRQLAIAIAIRQQSFLGKPLNIRYGKAIVVCTEDYPATLRASLTKQLGSKKTDELLENLLFVFESKGVPVILQKILAATSVDLIVIDAWGDIYQGNPNTYNDVREGLAPLHRIALEHQCAIVILHHTVKNSEKNAPDKNALNGSQSLEAKLRLVLELRLGEKHEERLLTILKGNHLSRRDKESSLILHFNEERLLFVSTGKIINKENAFRGKQNRLVQNPDEWKKRFQRIRETGLAIHQCVEKLQEEYGNEKVPSTTWFKENSN